MWKIKAIKALNRSFLQVTIRNVIRHRRPDHEIDGSEVSHDPGPSLGGVGLRRGAAWVSQPSLSSMGPTIGQRDEITL